MEQALFTQVMIASMIIKESISKYLNLSILQVSAKLVGFLA
jgi:hypothetical protein